MAVGPENSGASSSQQLAANLGLLRPPLVYLCAIGLGVVLDLAWPAPFLASPLSVPVGTLLLVLAAVLFWSSVRTFSAAGTSVRGNKPTTAIVRSGPYRFSRNPIYLSFSLLQLGIAIWADSLWLLATLVAAVALMAFAVIPREERYLEEKFGAEYRDYKASVRRWL